MTTDPSPDLAIAVARAIAVAECEPGEIPGHRLCKEAGCVFDPASPHPFPVNAWVPQAEAAIAAVYAYDLTRRSDRELRSLVVLIGRTLDLRMRAARGYMPVV